MLDPWNDRSILPPPVNTSQSESDVDLTGLKHSCASIKHVLSKQSPLHKESAIFSRFVYKFDKKFRNDIGYRSFKKVNTALHRYLVLELLKDVQNFMDCLPSESENSQYLPTRQMLEYVLVRLITFSKVMLRIIMCSKQAAIFYLNRIKRGESHWMCLMPYALLSRVWSLGLVLLQHSNNWYNRLYQYLRYLPIKGVNFLPNNCALPNNLEQLINMKSLNNMGRFEWTQKLSLDIDTILVEDEEGDLCENILKYVNNINRNSSNSDEPDLQMILPIEEIESRSTKRCKMFNHDPGEAISRESFRQYMNKATTSVNVTDQSNNSNHAINNVIDKNSLREFITNEERLRNNTDKQSLTNHLSFMQWQALKYALLKLDNPLINCKKLERKTKLIWKDKCLDYK